MKRMCIRGAVVLALLPRALAGAARNAVVVPPPNGVDDTAGIQAALDECVASGPGCTVQLAAGTCLTRQLVANNFRGTFEGLGKDGTILEGSPLPVTACWNEDCEWWPPDTKDHLWMSTANWVSNTLGQWRVLSCLPVVDFLDTPGPRWYRLPPLGGSLA
jgi:hypothetical protein